MIQTIQSDPIVMIVCDSGVSVSIPSQVLMSEVPTAFIKLARENPKWVVERPTSTSLTFSLQNLKPSCVQRQ